jgi:glutamine synthetase
VAAATSPVPAAGTRVGLLGADRLREEIAAGRIESVLLALPDGQGRLKGKQFDARYFLERIAADDGAAAPEFCAYLLATDIEMRPVSGYALTSWGGGYGDIQLAPDLGTARLLPWQPGTALVLADALGPGGGPLPFAPRTVLHRQLELLAAQGLEVRVGVETEFVLYHGTLAQAAAADYRGLRPVTWDNRDYALDQPKVVTEFSARLRTVLAAAGLPVEAVKLESAPGQVEVTFPYGEAMAACEGHLLFKHAVRTVAEDFDLAASFMAAPEQGVGSGLHLHVSLWCDGNPVLAGTSGRDPLSPLGGHAVAGLLAALPQLVPLYAPTPNSYKRFADHSFAPTRFAWGVDNRTCGVRVVGHGAGRHLEVRLPGADANPFLALAAVLAGARYGIEQGSEPPKPVAGDAYTSDSPPVPRSLEAALAAFGESAVAMDLLGHTVVAHYAYAARVELDVHHSRVTDVERIRGFAQT